jgi:two-component system chemotaxis response regulator CheY
LKAGEPYDLICLDIVMPEMDGQEALKEIRCLEKKAGITGSDFTKIIMTTALADKTNVVEATLQGCDYFLVKPIQKAKLQEQLRKLKLIS